MKKFLILCAALGLMAVLCQADTAAEVNNRLTQMGLPGALTGPDVACIFQAADGTQYNLNGMTKTNGDYTGSASGYDYQMNVCGTCNTCIAQCKTEGAGVCQTQNGAFVSMISSWTANPTFTWAQIDPNNPKAGVKAVSSNGAPKCGPSLDKPRNAEIHFECAPSTAATIYSITEDVPTCTFFLKIKSKQGCPVSGGGGGGSSGGISGGWVFIIIILVCTFVYVVGGCLFQHYRNEKAFGKEACPNVVFWRECPSLVKDGYAFTWAKLRGLCNNDGGGGGASYQEYGDEE